MFVLMALLLSASAFAQRPGFDPANMPKIATMSGTVLDADDNRPVEYANIVLYSHRDSAMVTGTITRPDGTFKMEELPFGKFYLVANFIGYEKKTISNIIVKPPNKDITIGTITLSKAMEMLDAVEITAEKQDVEYMIDKKVVNVSQSIHAASGTAIDVLENTPSVQTDIDGNISLRGSSNFTVLINGKPSIIEGSDALQQIPASTIENIEIITNPSAKYDPEGVAGIINVILKKQKKGGVTGIVNLSAGTNDKYKGDFLINYRKNGLNVFGGAEYMDYNFLGENTTFRRTGTDTTNYFYQNMSGERNFRRYGYRIRTGMDYTFNDFNSFSITISYGNRSFGMYSDGKIHNYDYMGTFEAYSYDESEMDRGGDYYGGNLYYEHKFNDKGQKISFTGDFSDRTSDDQDERTSSITDQYFYINDASPYKQITIEEGSRIRQNYQIDYENPFSENRKLEAGYKASLRNANSDYIYEDFDYTTNLWKSIDSLNNELEVDYMVHAAYGLYAASAYNIDYQLGFRAEYMDRNIKQIKTNDEYKVEQLDYFPTIHLSRDLTKKIQLQASYSKRIRRPRGWYFNPFPVYMNDKNFREGNPELRPELTDSYEMNFMYRYKLGFFTAEGYYRRTNDKIERIQESLDNNVVKYTFENLKRDHSIGIEVMTNVSPYKWWNINASGNVFNYTIEGAEVTEDNTTTTTNTWDARLNNTFRVKNNTRFQLMAFYMGPSITSQGEREGFYTASVSARQDFWKKNATVSLQVRDVFGSMKHNFIVDTYGLYSENEFSREGQVVTLSFTYRINNYKNGKKERGGGDAEFEGEGMY